MKKIVIAAMLAVSVATSAFAAPEAGVSSFAVNSFNAEFEGATDVSWSAFGDYARASFTINGKSNVAFYNYDGSMVGVTNSITVDQLPVKAKRIFGKQYNGYTVKEAIRFENEDEVAYFISAENDKEKIILKVSENGSFSTFRKTQK